LLRQPTTYRRTSFNRKGSVFFQTLDENLACVGVYHEGNLIFDDAEVRDIIKKSKATWKYSPHLSKYQDKEYAFLYTQGKTIAEVCPDHLLEEWENATAKMRAHYRALKIAKVDTNANCIWDMIPGRDIKELCEVKTRITEHVLENYERPANYDHLLQTAKLLEKIRRQRVTVEMDKRWLTSSDKATVNMARLLRDTVPYTRYNQFGTRTGRLTTEKGSFPILTLKKELRTAIKPKNDLFLELDYNGAELRVLLGMLGHEQPSVDVHQWNVDNVFDGDITREEAKTNFFAWLYGSRHPKIIKYGKVLEKFYDKDALLDRYWDRKTISTDFHRILETDEYHALNFLVQSTSADMTLDAAVRLDNLLDTYAAKTEISFLIHDSVVLDFSLEDKPLLKEILDTIQATKWGKFKINAAAGTDLGTLKKMKV